MPVSYDNSRVIRPNVEIQWTDDMVKEFAKCARSVKHFALNHIKVIHPTKGIIPYELRKYQMEMFELLDDNQKNIFLLPRQAGKCVYYDTKIKIKNKKTGEIKEIKIGDFLESIKNK